MQKTCKQCGVGYKIEQEDLDLFAKISPVFNGKRFDIPPPEMCPQCRFQRRLAFRNERTLYSRKCDFSGKDIISTYDPAGVYTVYDQDVWWGSEWDGTDFGRDYDFNKTFTEQLRELNQVAPHISLYTVNVENSYYSNFALNQKNVYLVFGAGDNEDCMYGKFVVYCKDCVDNLSVYYCEFCYEGVASEKCNYCRFFKNCRNCSDCIMVEECTGCRNCISCAGLKNKEFCILNKQYSQEDYKKIAKDYEYLTHEKIATLRSHLDELKKNLPHESAHIYASENCTGDAIYNCKNTKSSFDCNECEDCKYMNFAPRSLCTHDCCFCAPDGVEFCYNVCSMIRMNNCAFLYLGGDCNDTYYSIECQQDSNLFGCVSLKHKQYCILNKQYTKEEYEELVPRIIEQMKKDGSALDGGQEWGEYLDLSLSAFAYNETIAQEYFPLDKEGVEKIGGRWKELKGDVPEGKVIDGVPEDIREVGDDICEKVLTCEATGKKFKIVPNELKYYKRLKVPLPLRCPDQRHKDRLAEHSSKELFERKCDKCGKGVESIYEAGASEKVYCTECYLQYAY